MIGAPEDFRDNLYTIDKQGHRKWVYPALVKGRFLWRRAAVAYPLMAFYLAIPWITINGDQAVEPTVKEQQIQREVAPAHLHGVLAADEAEIAPELDQKIFEPQQQATMQVGFQVVLRQLQKFDEVAVFENAGGFWMSLCQQC